MSMDDKIKECDVRASQCIMAAARSTGFRRWVNLQFARFFSWAGDAGREIQRDWGDK